jgi:D-alanyl-D-alanine carboxypeptidase/D-alanyl-D-alanine-endopeptidase (penicillin-binding protein 4)
MLKASLFVLSSVVCCNVLAEEWQDLQSLLPKGTQVSYLVVDAKQQKKIASFNQETLRTPASVQKLLTATVAKLSLGEKFRYQTTVTGDINALKHGIYKGDLSLNFTGDPTLTRDNIRALLSSIKNLGVNKIEGNFVIDNSHFNGYQWSNGQPWNDLSVCFTSPPNAIIINRNCVLGNLNVADPKAQKATLFIPDYQPMNITSDVKIVTQKQKNATFCDLETTRDSNNKYHLWGCLVARKQPFPLAFSVNDPDIYAQKIVQAELKNVGINLVGRVNINSIMSPLSQQPVLASHRAVVLDELLKKMMKRSDNLIADSLFKTVGANYYKQPGNFRNGAQAMRAILKAQGVDLANAYIADGSGLSRHNLMSAELFMTVMQYVYQNESKLRLLDSLAVSGVDGTLRYNKGVNAPELKGNILAKTGSLKGVTNLVGVVKGKTGDKLFVMMINGYNPENSSMNAAIPRQKNASVTLFEKEFFKRIYN